MEVFELFFTNIPHIHVCIVINVRYFASNVVPRRCFGMHLSGIIVASCYNSFYPVALILAKNQSNNIVVSGDRGKNVAQACGHLTIFLLLHHNSLAIY